MNAMQLASELALFSVVTVAVVQDVRTAKISNRLILSGLIISLVFRVILGGTSQIFFFLGNISLPVILLYLFYVFGILGAGDIKLFSVIGGFINFKMLMDCVFFAFLAGACLGVLQMIRHRNLRTSLWRSMDYIRQLLQGRFMTYTAYGVKEQNKMHFSIAILIGLIIARVRCGG